MLRQEIEEYRCSNKAKGVIQKFADDDESVKDLLGMISKLERPDISKDPKLLRKIGDLKLVVQNLYFRN